MHTKRQQRYFKYHESVTFNHSRLRHFRCERSGGTCAHGEKRGEEHPEYSQECRTQYCEGHQTSRTHCGRYLHAVNRGNFTTPLRVAHSATTIEYRSVHWIADLHTHHCQGRDRLERNTVRTQTCRKLSNHVSGFFWRMAIRSFLRLQILSIRTGDFIRPILVGLLIATVFLAGIQLRRWIGDTTRHVRYQHDIVNAFYWGSEVLKEARRLSPDEASANSWAGFCRGYFALYDRVKHKAYKNDYGLDYPPLRLLVMAIWAKQVRDGFPAVDDGHPKLVNPLLKINLLCELLSAVAIFLLVRLCLRESSSATRSSLLRILPQQHCASICGLAAASVAWLEPSMILDAHGWPQWDVWILPFYLFAALAALKDRWFYCGCLLVAGAMFKGQLLFVAPFFLLWPLWQKRWASALRMLAGFAATTALVVLPWLLRTPAAWVSVAAISTLSLLVVLRFKLPHGSAWLAGITGCAVFVIGALTGGSFAWLQVGFIYGTQHYPYLFISSCYNLPSLLSKVGWSLKDSFLSAHFGSLHLHLTLQWTLRLLYLGGLILCAGGLARHLRDRDPRALITIAVPWLLMFALLGQMHERYLMWGAVVSALALGVSVRLTVIHFIISLASTAMIVHVMLIDKKLEATLSAIDVLKHIRPYGSVAVLACVAFYLWDALSKRLPAFQYPAVRSGAPPSLSLGPEPEEA
jgi:glycosyl transferase family 87